MFVSPALHGKPLERDTLEQPCKIKEKWEKLELEGVTKPVG